MRFNFATSRFEDELHNVEKLAFIGSDGTITWQKFNQLVKKIVTTIKAQNLPKGYPIAIYGHKQLLFPASIIACLITEHPFIPIDELYPTERINEILTETNSNVIIDCTNNLIRKNTTIIQADKGNIQVTSNASITATVLPYFNHNPLSYVLFTSGSTGKPKGVMIRKNSVLSLVDWIKTGDFNMSEHDVFVNQSPFSFDVSLMDTIANLVYGATMLMVSQDLAKDTNLFKNALIEYGATHWTSTPSFIYLYQRENWFNSIQIPSLKKFLFAGEPLAPAIAKSLHTNFEHCTVWNAYGPTEATVITTLLKVNESVLNQYTSLPIGYAKPNTKFITIPENATKDKPGELVIVGDNVAEGYLNRAEQTADRFYKYDNEPAYKTGDLGYIENNLIFCLGRNDDQIKFNGYRIELEEISNKILAHNDIIEVKTIGLKRDGKVIRIVSLFQANKTIPSAELKSKLTTQIPYYMVPSDFLQVDNFPINNSGKIDRNKLQDFYLAEKKKKR